MFKLISDVPIPAVGHLTSLHVPTYGVNVSRIKPVKVFSGKFP